MKTYSRTINGQKVDAYKDSGAEWVVQIKGMTTQRFDCRKWTMRDAMEFAEKLHPNNYTG